uniref:RING-type E3 ubiquitin transferase n=1 Tax=Oryza punctata TaxID=4537 RepID=A0A0E0L9D6_ORYPU
MPTPPRHRHHALPLALALAALLLATADGQPNESRDKNNGSGGGGFMAPSGGMSSQSPSFSAPMVVLLVALIAAFFFIGFFSIYIRRCGGEGSTGPTIPAAALAALSRQEQRSRQQQRGLDPAVVESFPTMKYAEARELRDGGKDAVLECAVCLSEFDDDEELRLLPKCSHAFHPDCIGEWLAGHVTCPVCRCNLAPEDPAAAAAVAEANVVSGEVAGEQQQEEVAIDVDRDGEEEDEERRREAMELERIGSLRRAVRSRSGRPLPRTKRDKTAAAADGSVSSAKGSVRFDCLGGGGGGGGGPSNRVVAFADDAAEDDDEKPIARQV